MLIWLARKLSASSSQFKRMLWRRWYEYLAGYNIAEWRFMNYGYAPLDANEQPLVLQTADEPNRNAIQLYARVAGAVDLQGLDALEAGCGRGGGSSFVKRYYHPQHLTAVDFSAKAIRFCQATHRMHGLTFVHGDVEAMPFADESFDAVINVESSHCYGSMAGFLREVKRVLRAGGYFLFADLRDSHDCDRLHTQLAETGMTVLERQDVTANVLEAMRQDSARKLALIERSVKKPLLGTFRQFAGIEGSEIFAGFQNGTARYVRYVLRK